MTRQENEKILTQSDLNVLAASMLSNPLAARRLKGGYHEKQ